MNNQNNSSAPSGDDAISKSKRILALVDDYVEKRDTSSRNALRGALMDEFTQPPTDRVQGGLTFEQRKDMELIIARLEQIKHLSDEFDARSLAKDALVCANAILSSRPTPQEPVASRATVPEGWSIQVTENEPESWLTITAPNGNSISYRSERGTIGAQVLQDMSIALDVDASEVSVERKAQASAVMPLIGPMLDAFDGLPGDLRSDLAEQAPGLYRHLKAIYASMLAAAPSPQEGNAVNGGCLRVPVADYLWLMGMGKDAFCGSEQGSFWWRGEFNRRTGLDMMKIYKTAQHASAQEGPTTPANAAAANGDGLTLDELAVQCGAASMVSSFTHPKGPRTSVKFKVDDGSLDRFAEAVVRKSAAADADDQKGEAK